MPHSDGNESAGGRLDRPALQRLIDAYWRRALAYVHRHRGPLLRAHEESVDVVQSVIADMLRGDRAWLVTDAVSHFRQCFIHACDCKIVDHIRRLRAQKRDPARERPICDASSGVSRSDSGLADVRCSTPSRILLAREEAARLDAALAKLTPEERDVITLSRLNKVSHAEIGRRLSRSEDAVRQALHRALDELSKHLHVRRESP